MRSRAIKKLRNAGKGAVLPFVDGTRATFHFEVRILPEDQENRDEIALRPNHEFELVEDSRKAWPDGYGQEMELIFGKKFTLEFFEECIRTMLLDEVASFDLCPIELMSYPVTSKKLRDIAKDRIHQEKHTSCQDHAVSSSSSCCWGMQAAAGLAYKHLDDLVSNPRALRFTFHLLKVEQPDDYEKQSWQLNSEEKLSSLDGLRRRGREAFTLGHWTEAAALYQEAINRLDSLMMLEKPGEPEHIDLDIAKATFYLNLAQCQLNLDEPYLAIASCTEALQRQPHMEKGLFRRARGYMAVWDLDAAEKDLVTLKQKHAKSVTLANQQLAKINELRAQKHASDRDQYLNIFNKTKQ